MFGLVNGLWKQAIRKVNWAKGLKLPNNPRNCWCAACSEYEWQLNQVDPAIRIPAHPNVYAQRLLNVVRALRESPTPEAFDMSWYTYYTEGTFPCGTPMCALGHYGAREDLQNAFAINAAGSLKVVDTSLAADDTDRMQAAQVHFGLRPLQASQLFGTCGCGRAQTAEEAASYIEKFVENHPKQFEEPNYGHGFTRAV